MARCSALHPWQDTRTNGAVYCVVEDRELPGIAIAASGPGAAGLTDRYP
jgi:hypothetical protein